VENKDFTLAWSFRNRPEVLEKSIMTAHSTCPIDVDFLLIDAASNKETIKYIQDVISYLPERKIRLCESFYRSSLGEAWNLALILSNTQNVIFASSDVYFTGPMWFNFLREIKNETQAKYILMDNHALFMIDKALVPIVGWYDESFSIGPHFDTDYYIRLLEKEIFIVGIPNNELYTHGNEPEIEFMRNNIAPGEDDTLIQDMLPMKVPENDKYFYTKWRPIFYTKEDMRQIHEMQLYAECLPEVINNYQLVERMLPEIDPHPLYTQKFKELYQ
jgi:hypothetical protein